MTAANRSDAVINFGPVYGQKGDSVFVPVKLKAPFKGEKLVAEDKDGAETIIKQIYVDGKDCLPAQAGSLWERLRARLRRLKSPKLTTGRLPPSAKLPTSAFAFDALGNGLSLPTCPAEKEIVIEIEFLSAGKWYGDLYGTSTS